MLTYKEFKQSILTQMLNEMPEHRAETQNQAKYIQMKDDGTPTRQISEDSLKRDFFILKKGHDSTFGDYIIALKNKKTIAGFYIYSHTRPEDSVKIYHVACLIQFKHPLINQIPDKLKHKEFLQISTVGTVPHYEGIGIASEVYIALADDGYVVVSDSVQYDGGKFLWKKLSRSHELNVFVYDRTEKDFLKDKQGNVIRYDTTNLTDDTIWLPGSPGQRFIFIAHK